MNAPPTLEFPQSVKDKLWLMMRRIYENIARVVNGNIEFGNPTTGPANLRLSWVSVTTPAVANSDFTITHNLGRVAVGYWIATKDRAVDIYTSPTANPNPTTQLILRATVASAVVTIIVI